MQLHTLANSNPYYFTYPHLYGPIPTDTTQARHPAPTTYGYNSTNPPTSYHACRLIATKPLQTAMIRVDWAGCCMGGEGCMLWTGIVCV